MRRLLLVPACAAVLVPVSIASAQRDAGVPVAHKCSGTVTRGVAGTLVRASSIRATKVSCTAGKAQLRRFLARASASGACRSAAGKPPPTTGCVVSGYHCFRKRDPDYCASVSGKLVQWHESHGVSGKPPR